MSIKTLSEIQILAPASIGFRRHTYSVTPILPTPAKPESGEAATELQIFLDGENPLGCVRGVLWVMAFNVAVFLLGFMIWQSCKYL